MHEFDYYVYMVRCCDGKLYIGITNDITRRIFEHNEGNNPKSYTYSRRPVELVYSAHFNDVHEAISWEKCMKRWSRKKKEALIRGDSKELHELAKNMYRVRIDGMVRRAHHDINSLCHPEPDEG